MRVLLIATNRHDRLMSRMDARPLPIGLAYVAGQLDPGRHAVKVLDLMFSEDYLADTERAVCEFRPDLVGISLRNLDNQSYLDPQWALPITREVIHRIREASIAPVVCGGPAFSILPRECFQFLEPDLGIAGDAAETFALLADRLDGKGPYSGTAGLEDLPGLVYRAGGQVMVSTQQSSSAFPKPPRLEELDMARYEKAGFGIGIVTKLGDFFYPTGAGGNRTGSDPWRVIRPIDEVVREARDMKTRFGLRKVFFIDNGFNVPPAHARALCRALLESGLDLHWNTCLAPIPEACDLEVVQGMAEAGCKLVIMTGMARRDGGNMGSATWLRDLGQVCHRCEEGGLHYTISQYFGEPGDTRETVERKLAFLNEISPAVASLRVGVRVLPGSAVAEAAVREGLISSESELIRPTFYVAPEVKDWIVDRLREAVAVNPRWNLM
jgi:hypothetical protein